jgi:hypothetical protein
MSDCQETLFEHGLAFHADRDSREYRQAVYAAANNANISIWQSTVNPAGSVTRGKYVRA